MKHIEGIICKGKGSRIIVELDASVGELYSRFREEDRGGCRGGRSPPSPLARVSFSQLLMHFPLMRDIHRDTGSPENRPKTVPRPIVRTGDAD